MRSATLVTVLLGTLSPLGRRADEPAGGGNPLAGGGASAGGPASPGAATRPGTGSGGNRPGVTGAGDGIRRNPQAPATPGRLADDDPQSAQWLNGLRGKVLTQTSSYLSGMEGGTSSRRRMVLYPNGRFEYYSFSSVSADVGGVFGNAGGQGTQTGTWRIVTAQRTSYLALVFDGNAQEEYAELDLRDGKVYVDGTRTFVTNPQ